MSAVPSPSPPPSVYALLRRRRRGAARGFDLVGKLALAVVVVLVLIAIFAPLIQPHDSSAVDLLNTFAPASDSHWLGTDGSGRDIASRLISGSRTALVAPLILVAASALLGSLLAISAAWMGGVYDQAVSRLLDFLLAFPAVLLALVVIALYGEGLQAAIIGLIPGYTATLARVVRSGALRERSQPYIAACTVQGLSGFAVCVRHLLPNVLPLITAQAAASFGYGMIDLASLSFLGFGAQPPTSDWGLMVSEGQQSIVLGHTTESISAGVLIVIAVVSFNAVSDRLVTRFGR